MQNNAVGNNFAVSRPNFEVICSEYSSPKFHEIQMWRAD